MNTANLKRILIAAASIALALFLAWFLFKAIVWLFTAAAVLVVAGIIYLVLMTKLKSHRSNRANTAP